MSVTEPEGWLGAAKAAVWRSRRGADTVSLTYDPPSGWRYGFPKKYEPRDGETLAQTLIRDGYPMHLARFGAQHCRFLGTQEELDTKLGKKERV